MLIGLWLLSAGPDADLVSLELVGMLLVLGTGGVVWMGWQARRRVAATLSAPTFGETLIPFTPVTGFAPLAGPGFVATAPHADDRARPSQRRRELPRGVDAAEVTVAARVAFIRLQAAWDAADRETLAGMTTPAMYAELEPVLDARLAGSLQRTDVVTLAAELVACEEDAGELLASVVYTGLIRDGVESGAQPFRELWMLARAPHGGDWKLSRQQTLY